MSAAPRLRLIPFVVSTALVLTGALAGCSGDDKDKADGKKSPSAAPTVVDGFTVPGLDLAFGEKATFKWQQGPVLAKKFAEVEATVEEVRKAQVKEFAGYQLTEAMMASTPYFVTVDVKNVGESDLRGKTLPIYLDNDGSTLYPAVEIPHFKKCAPSALPQKFGPGATAKLCLVFLAPEGTTLRSIALLHNDKEQIDWTGKVVDPVAEKKKRAAEKKAEKKAKKEQQKKDKKASGSPSPSASKTD